MPIIARVGQKSWRIRALFAGIYLVLSGGSIAMVYPFLILVSGSFKSAVDVNEYDIVPRYFYDDIVLHRKYVEERYNESMQALWSVYPVRWDRFEEVLPPAAYNSLLLKEWRAFLASDEWKEEFPETNGRIPLSHFSLGAYTSMSYRKPYIYHAWIQDLALRFGSVEKMNAACGTNYTAFTGVFPFVEQWNNRRYVPPDSNAFYDSFIAFKDQVRNEKPRFLIPISGDGLFRVTYLWPKYGREIEAYNRSHGTRFNHYSEVILSEHAPRTPSTYAEWQEYLEDPWHFRNLRWSTEGKEAFRRFLGRSPVLLEAVCKACNHPEIDAQTLPLADAPVQAASPALENAIRSFILEGGGARYVALATAEDWAHFVRNELHIQNIRITPRGEALFKKFLRDFYTAASLSNDALSPLDLFSARYKIQRRGAARTIQEAVEDFQLRQPVSPIGPEATDFAMFITEECPVEEIRLVTLDILFARFLERRYGSVSDLTRAAQNSWVFPMGSFAELTSRLSPEARRAFLTLRENSIDLIEVLERQVQGDRKSVV